MRHHQFPVASFVLLFALIPSHGQAPATGSVRGTVTYADSGKPAGSINLWLEPAEPPTAPQPDPVTGELELHDGEGQSRRLTGTVAADGTFTVNAVPPGSYVIHTYAPPYLPADGTIYPTSSKTHVVTGPQVSTEALRVEVLPGQAASLTVMLRLGGSIEGTVRSSGGLPVSSKAQPPYGLAVNAEMKLGPNTYARVGTVARTDAIGHFRLEGLPPGDYIVFAAAPGSMVQTGTGLVGGSGLPLYAPGTVRPSDATVIHVAGTATGHADVTFPPATTLHRVEGNVVLNGAEALRGVTVRLYPKDEGGLTASTPLQANAGFSFPGVPDGEYTISIDFPTRREVLSADRERGIVRMRVLPALYEPVLQDVRVNGQDVSGVLIRPSSAVSHKF